MGKRGRGYQQNSFWDFGRPLRVFWRYQIFIFIFYFFIFKVIFIIFYVSNFFNFPISFLSLFYFIFLMLFIYLFLNFFLFQLVLLFYYFRFFNFFISTERCLVFDTLNPLIQNIKRIYMYFDSYLRCWYKFNFYIYIHCFSTNSFCHAFSTFQLEIIKITRGKVNKFSILI